MERFFGFWAILEKKPILSVLPVVGILPILKALFNLYPTSENFHFCLIIGLVVSHSFSMSFLPDFYRLKNAIPKIAGKRWGYLR